MGSPEFEYEAWEYQIVVDSTHEGSITVTEDGGSPVTIDLDAGTYYPGELRTELQSELNGAAGLSGTYTVAVHTPSKSNDVGKRGLSIKASGLSTSLSMTVSSGAADTSPRPEEWLGWGGDATVNAIAQGSDFVLISPYSTVGTWVPREPRALAYRQSQRLSRGSTPYTEQADSFTLNRGVREVRSWRYEYLPAAFVLDGRGKVAAYATTAGIATGDVGNAFEWLWLRLSDGEPAKVKVYSANTPLDGTPEATETCYIDGVEQGAEMGDLLRLQRLDGEYFVATFRTAISDTDWDY